jgi:molybdenum cofactor cytidylyltransferase
MKNIIGIYLAAGSSKRMGKCKLSLPLSVKPLGTIALKEIMQSNIDHFLVVTNDFNAVWLNSADDLHAYPNKWENIVSLQAHLGQSFSLKSGIRRALQLGAESIVVFLADQPFVTSGLINRLINEARNEHDYVASAVGGVLKPPIIFNLKALAKIMTIRGDEGARSLLKNGTLTGTSIEVNSDQLFDIDTVEDYEYARSFYLRNSNKIS